MHAYTSNVKAPEREARRSSSCFRQQPSEFRKPAISLLRSPIVRIHLLPQALAAARDRAYSIQRSSDASVYRDGTDCKRSDDDRAGGRCPVSRKFSVPDDANQWDEP